MIGVSMLLACSTDHRTPRRCRGTATVSSTHRRRLSSNRRPSDFRRLRTSRLVQDWLPDQAIRRAGYPQRPGSAARFQGCR